MDDQADNEMRKCNMCGEDVPAYSGAWCPAPSGVKEVDVEWCCDKCIEENELPTI